MDDGLQHEKGYMAVLWPLLKNYSLSLVKPRSRTNGPAFKRMPLHHNHPAPLVIRILKRSGTSILIHMFPQPSRVLLQPTLPLINAMASYMSSAA